MSLERIGVVKCRGMERSLKSPGHIGSAVCSSERDTRGEKLPIVSVMLRM
jgi:hypothetical protein